MKLSSKILKPQPVNQHFPEMPASFRSSLESDLSSFIFLNFGLDYGKQAIETLQSYDLYEQFENTFRMLKNLTETQSAGLPLKISGLAQGMFSYVIIKAQSLPGTGKKSMVYEVAINIGKAILLDMVNKNKREAKEVFGHISLVFEMTCTQFNMYDQDVARKFERELSSISNEMKPDTAATANECQYIWNDKAKLPELVDRLKKKQLIRRKNQFFNLFQFSCDDLTVEWDNKRKLHLAKLLNRLFKENYCSVRGGKGYFAFAEQHFVGFNGDTFREGSLRKLSSRVNKEPEKFVDVIRDIDEILSGV